MKRSKLARKSSTHLANCSSNHFFLLSGRDNLAEFLMREKEKQGDILSQAYPMLELSWRLTHVTQLPATPVPSCLKPADN